MVEATVRYSAELSDYRIRPNVEKVHAYWSLKTPSVHNVASKCMPLWDDTEQKDRKWLEAAFNKEIAGEGNRQYMFCSRCVLELDKEEVTVAALKAVVAATKDVNTKADAAADIKAIAKAPVKRARQRTNRKTA